MLGREKDFFSSRSCFIRQSYSNSPSLLSLHTKPRGEIGRALQSKRTFVSGESIKDALELNIGGFCKGQNKREDILREENIKESQKGKEPADF